MKRKEWKVLLSNTADTCKHTQFVCTQCSSTVFIHKIPTKTSMLQMGRLIRKVKKIEEELANPKTTE